MAVLQLHLFCLVAVYIYVAIPRTDSANFPLDDCSTGEMDVLFLLFDNIDSLKMLSQHKMSEHFIEDLLNFHSKINQPVKFANVIDKFSALSHHVNVSSWYLHSSLGSDPYGLDEQHVIKPKYQNITESIELKVTFVARLFSEMGGVRENVTHVGVIFLDGSGLSYEESRSVPHTLQQRSTGIKIFMLIFAKYRGATYVSDTLIVHQDIYIDSRHILTLAICNKCIQGWFMFEDNEVTNSRSCYKLIDAKVPINWDQAVGYCHSQNAYLLATESKTELNLLQAKIISYLSKYRYHRGNTSHFLSAEIIIGLQRDSYSNSERFHWSYLNSPLVVNNWMPGKPSGGRDNGCGVWKFVFNDNCNETCSPLNNDTFDQGWIDIDCQTKISSFGLCEINIPVRSEKNLLKINPASNESFKRALYKGNFVTFRDNIVSITANIANNDFLQFLKKSGIEFPIFDCGVEEDHPRYISFFYVCDDVNHCRNRRDETFCNFKQVTENDVKTCPQKCKSVYCCDGSCLPLQFINDGEIDCFVCGYGKEKVVHDESEIIIHNYKRNTTCVFFCNLDECISQAQLNDGHKDCFGPEGPLDETIGKLQSANICYNSLGKSNWSPMCVFVVDTLGTVLGCRDMSHLESCTDFVCPEGYFKCPNTYCIPQHYVLDGKTDCPLAEDEQRDVVSPCSGNFACWDSQICLHPDLVCDGSSHCPYQDDEVDCGVSCPEGFRCMSGTVTVSDYNISIPLTSVLYVNKRVTYMDLTGVDLSIANFYYFIYTNMPLVIIWSNCKINTIDKYLSFFVHVHKLDLSYNLIQTIDGSYVDYSPLEHVRHLNLSHNKELAIFTFLQMSKLEVLDLSHTGLTDIDGSFYGLPNLKHLNLSFTFVTEIHKIEYHSKLILLTLDLRGLTMKNVFADMFYGLTVRQDLYTDSFEMCCPQIRGPNIPYYACHAPDDAISSCFDLIGVSVQRVLLWVFAVLAVLVNLAVFGYRVILDRSFLKTGYALFVANLSISDIIMGVYLFIIAGADYYYRDIYVLYDKVWRESVICRLAGFLATLSSETSILFIFFITLDRFLMIKFPFGQVKFTKLSKIIAVLLSWIIGLLLAMSPNMLSFEIYSSNAMCLGLPLTSKQFKGWEFSFGVFIVFNFCMCLVIAYGQKAIFRAMLENRITETALNMSPRRAECITVARQLSLIALSNFFCWFPVGIMGLMLLVKYEISKEVYAWTTVVVLPINSAANPLLYTIPAIMTRWEKVKKIKASNRQ